VSTTVQEDISVGTEVAKVYASDVDTTHDSIMFTLSGGNIGHDFQISQFFDSNRQLYYGSITTQHELDHDLGQTLYTLKVRISDGIGFGEANTNDIDVEIELEDVNDNPPVFDEEQYTVTIAETTAINTTIMTGKVTDLDQNQTFTFHLAENERRFNVNFSEDTFSIQVVETLIGFGGERFTVSLTASDSVHETTVEVRVKVDDINLNEPKIFYNGENPSSVSIIVDENYRTDQPVITIHAEDEDRGKNGEVRFTIKDQVSFLLDFIQCITPKCNPFFKVLHFGKVYHFWEM